MSTYPEHCCPVLRTAATAERLRCAGIDTSGHREPVVPLLVAVARDEHGCPGPNQHGMCPYERYHGGEFKLREDVPLIGVSRNTGSYL